MIAGQTKMKPGQIASRSRRARKRASTTRAMRTPTKPAQDANESLAKRSLAALFQMTCATFALIGQVTSTTTGSIAMKFNRLISSWARKEIEFSTRGDNDHDFLTSSETEESGIAQDSLEIASVSNPFSLFATAGETIDGLKTTQSLVPVDRQSICRNHADINVIHGYQDF